MKIKIWISILLLTVLIKVNAQVISSIEFHVNTNIGNDTANGTSKYPLKTLTEAAKRVNELNGKGSVTIILSEGTYGLYETAKFNPKNRELNKENRLIIRAEVLPNDQYWAPGKMPIIVSTMPFKFEKNDKNEVTDGANYGIEINTSHVTIQGLKILGEPVHENPKKDVLIRNYPIVWEGNNLTDLNVTQCLFLGNKFALPNHLGILANGNTAYEGALIEMVSHGVIALGLFFIADMIESRVGHDHFNKLGGLREKHPAFAFLFFVIVMASVALPLTSGFAGEFLLLQSVGSHNIVMALVAGLTVVFGAVYMLRAFQSTMLGKHNAELAFAEMTASEKMVLTILVIITIAIGVYPGMLLDVVHKGLQLTGI